MTGFRNIAVHEYRQLDVDIVVSIIRKDTADLIRFTEIMLALDWARRSFQVTGSPIPGGVAGARTGTPLVDGRGPGLWRRRPRGRGCGRDPAAAL